MPYLCFRSSILDETDCRRALFGVYGSSTDKERQKMITEFREHVCMVEIVRGDLLERELIHCTFLHTF
jgi:hypothetical protein